MSEQVLPPEPMGKCWMPVAVPSTTYFAVGPLLKAELLESVAVPELKQQAYDLAHKIGGAIKKQADLDTANLTTV